MKRLLLPVMVLGIAAASCGTGRGPLPDKLVRKLETPDGTELKFACPPTLADADPEKAGTAIAQFNINTPSSVATFEAAMPTESPDSIPC